MEGFANLFKGIEGVGGKLYLSEDSLVHKPHSMNVQSQVTTIMLRDVAEVKTRNTAFIIPNGLSVTTKDGKEYKFVVYGRTKWVAAIRGSMSKLK